MPRILVSHICPPIPQDIEFGSNVSANDADRWYIEGKDDIVQESDVVHSRFNV